VWCTLSTSPTIDGGGAASHVPPGHNQDVEHDEGYLHRHAATSRQPLLQRFKVTPPAPVHHQLSVQHASSWHLIQHRCHDLREAVCERPLLLPGLQLDSTAELVKCQIRRRPILGGLIEHVPAA
jgi:hypothetical protein